MKYKVVKVKYKVVKDASNVFPCISCAFNYAINCEEVTEENNLPDCYVNHCHFELADEITDVDLREIDEARDNRPGIL
jgi:hypothetical protein